jgi:sugar/nucleoside kinase (ribokinase family)
VQGFCRSSASIVTGPLSAHLQQAGELSMEKKFDCVLCGSCVVDILVRPVPLETPIGDGKLIVVDPIEVTTGGIVSNTGVAMAKLGMKVSAFTYVGDDEWASVVRRKFQSENVDTSRLLTHPTAATSTTAVLIDPSGERSFAHCVGAPKLMDKALFLEHFDLFTASRMAVIGYYSLMPNLEDDLPEILAKMRSVGCMTVLDSAGDGGGLKPLDRILPHLDAYVPSHSEAVHQTGESDPRKILEIFRACGAPRVLGVKLGSKGALLSPAPGQILEVPCITPPRPIVDTTGAGDCFYAGLLTGLLQGMALPEAGRLGAATAACCITGMGATAGLRGYQETMRLAGLSSAGPCA